MLQLSLTHKIFALRNYLNETTSDKTLSSDSLSLTLFFSQQVLPKQPSIIQSLYLSVISLLIHRFTLVMPLQSNYLLLAHDSFEPRETGPKYTSKVETHGTHYEYSKETVVKQLCRPLLLLAS